MEGGRLSVGGGVSGVDVSVRLCVNVGVCADVRVVSDIMTVVET